MTWLASKDRDDLIGLLETCEVIRADVRNQLLERLPPDVSASVTQSPRNRVFASSLVTTCARFPDGLHRLGLAVRFFEGERSFAMRDIGTVLLRVTLNAAVYHIATGDPDALDSFVAVNLAAEIPPADDSAELQDLAHRAHAAISLAHDRNRLDQEFIQQLMYQTDDAATCTLLKDIASTWLPYARPPRHMDGSVAPAAPAIEEPAEESAEATPIRDPPGQTQTAPTSPGPPPPLEIPRGAPGRLSLVLDRFRQWIELTALCNHSDEHLAFLIHGRPNQSLHLFSGRVQDFLHSHDCPRLHDVFQVPLRTHYTRANDASVWAAHLRRALGAGRALGMPGLIRKKTNHEAIMLIIGNGVLRGLDNDEERALINFLGRELPAWIEQAAPKNPVRVLVPIEYVEPTADESPLLAHVRQALKNPETCLRLVELRPVEFPPWTDVATTLNHEFPNAPAEFLARALALYQEMANREPLPTFAALANALENLAQDMMGPANA